MSVGVYLNVAVQDKWMRRRRLDHVDGGQRLTHHEYGPRSNASSADSKNLHGHAHSDISAMHSARIKRGSQVSKVLRQNTAKTS